MFNKFYLVWEPNSGYTKYKHYEVKDATEEAERLAKKELGKEFYILEAKSSIQIQKAKPFMDELQARMVIGECWNCFKDVHATTEDEMINSFIEAGWVKK